MRSIRLLLMLLVGSCAVPTIAAESWSARLEPLLQGHCFDCHGADVQEAGLRLDALSTDLHDAAVARRWERVFDKLSAGEMPPKSEERPPAALLESAIELLRESLHQASLERQHREGRVLVRRLNNVEYENTLHDLLGINAPLKELLPEDTSAHGFDNVGDALHTSSFLLEK